MSCLFALELMPLFASSIGLSLSSEVNPSSRKSRRYTAIQRNKTDSIQQLSPDIRILDLSLLRNFFPFYSLILLLSIVFLFHYSRELLNIYNWHIDQIWWVWDRDNHLKCTFPYRSDSEWEEQLMDLMRKVGEKREVVGVGEGEVGWLDWSLSLTHLIITLPRDWFSITYFDIVSFPSIVSLFLLVPFMVQAGRS